MVPAAPESNFTDGVPILTFGVPVIPTFQAPLCWADTVPIRAWKKLIRCRSFSAAVIDPDQSASDNHIIAFGAGVCVSPDFAQEEISNPHPGLNARLIASIDSGQSVALTDE